MKANIDVKDRREAEAIKAGLEDPVLRAMVMVVGALKQLPTARARARVLQYVEDRLDEEEQLRKVTKEPTQDQDQAATNGGNP